MRILGLVSLLLPAGLLACSSAATLPPPLGSDGGHEAAADAQTAESGDAGMGSEASLPPAILLASNQNGASYVRLGGDQVLWLDSPPAGGSGTIMAVPKAGGTPAQLVTESGIGLFVADSARVYWVSGHTNLMATAIAGGTPTTLASGLSDAEGLALDATYLYVDVGANLLSPRDIVRVPLSGGSPVPVVTAQSVSRFTIDATNVYWMTTSPAALMKAPLSGGGAPTMLAAPPLPSDSPITAGPTGIYWSASNASLSALTIYAVPLVGGAATPLATVPGVSIFDGTLALDSVSAYVGYDDVYRVPLAGATAAAVAGGTPFDVAIDDTSVYFASVGAVDPNGNAQSVGSVWKAPK